MTPGEFEELVVTGVLPVGEAGGRGDTPPVPLTSPKPLGAVQRFLRVLFGVDRF